MAFYRFSSLRRSKLDVGSWTFDVRIYFVVLVRCIQFLAGSSDASVQLDDQVFSVAQRRASDAGYSSVDQYLADVVFSVTDGESDNFDHCFTPQVIAELDQISADIKSGGRTCTMDQVREHFENKRKQSLANHAS